MPQQLTAQGRIVWGHPGKPRPKKDDNGNPVMKDGQQVQQWSFGLAVPKLTTCQAQGIDPMLAFENAVWPYFDAEAKTGFPNQPPQDFSWKFRDGDSFDRQGKSYAEREGYGGHYVIAISTEAFAPPLFRWDGQQYHALTPEELKTGDFVAVSLNLKLNIPQNRSFKPGIYVNPNGICFVGYGQEIFNGPDAQTMFGGQNFAMMPGASAAPIMAAGAPGMPGQQPMQPQGGMPGQQPMQPQGGMPGQQPMQPQGGMPGQQPMQPQGGMPGQQPMQPQGGGMPGQQPMQPQGGMPGQQPMQPQGGMPGQQPMQPQGGMPGQQPMQPQGGGMPAPATDFVQNAGNMPGGMPPR